MAWAGVMTEHDVYLMDFLRNKVVSTIVFDIVKCLILTISGIRVRVMDSISKIEHHAK